LNKYLNRMTGFMGTAESIEECQAVLIGLPMDFTVSHRPGSRSAPQAIRNISFALEEYSVYQDKSLLDMKFYDAGDVSLPFGNIKECLKRIEEVAQDVFASGKLPLFMGGEHLVTYPLVRACRHYHPDLVILHFDAHADLRTEYEGEKESHATVMNKIAGLLGKDRIYQFGIRSGTEEEFIFARQYTRLYVDEIFPALDRVIEEVRDKPVYITLDIDVVDPAYAPGTGTPEPGGCTSREILSAIRAMKNLHVVGMDMVEISPLNDKSDITAILGAKLVREALLAYVK